MSSSLFWNNPSDIDQKRAADPLGFDALREAMSDDLAPLLTGVTRSADEYLWTVIGLRWAKEATKANVDAELFGDGFAPFERALKQFWCKFDTANQWHIAGITVVRSLCEGKRPDISRPILADQRATGLVGNYIVSLRGLGVVQDGSLQIIDSVVGNLLQDVDFPQDRKWISSWDALEKACRKVDLRAARKRLGRLLFSGANSRMRLAALAALRRPLAQSWSETHLRCLDAEQRRLARATKLVTQLERAALDVFAEMLQGVEAIASSKARALRTLASAAQRTNPFPTAWQANNPIAVALREGIDQLAQSENPVNTLYRMHLAVTRDARRGTPWLDAIGQHSVYSDWRPATQRRDFRFSNLRALVRQTGWKAHAA
ncbi:hypothetical protein [Paraburkholderia sp. 2C]